MISNHRNNEWEKLLKFKQKIKIGLDIKEVEGVGVEIITMNKVRKRRKGEKRKRGGITRY